jgi:signal transduction histidine kinase
MIVNPRFVSLLFIFLLLCLAGAAVLFLFHKKLYSRLSARVSLLVLASGFMTLVISLAFDQINGDTVPPSWVRFLQIALLILGGPAMLGLFAARFVRRPLRQFNDTIASLEQSNYKVQLQPTGISEFDEIFMKFNNLVNRLQREEKLRKDLVSDASHELNTPLTTMIGQLTAIQEGKYPMTEERVVMLKEQAERLAELVQQLNTYTKARSPDIGEPENIPLKRLCDELMSHFSLELKQKAITTNIDIAEDYILRADRHALQQILTNLIQNTLRYSQATEITIEATAREVTFSDNGRGVPTESLPHLFERFYRVDTSRNRTTGGLGLGLAIVRELVENQGWTITASSEQPGLTFTLKIKT